ncbi:unnamed protein product [Diamesa tonsa]
MVVVCFVCYVVVAVVVQKRKTPQNGDDVTCGKASDYIKDCFKNATDSSIDMWQTNSAPYTLEDINSRCLLFDQGMKCFHTYTNKCFDAMNKRLMEGEVLPAKIFYDMLCKDSQFQQDFMKHRDCFQHIQKDQNICTKDFKKILGNEFTRTQRESTSNIDLQYMHFCCARYGYENCVFNAARHKCNRDGAVFARKLVSLLSSEKHFKNCNRIENSICAAPKILSINIIPFVSLILFFNLFV